LGQSARASDYDGDRKESTAACGNSSSLRAVISATIPAMVTLANSALHAYRREAKPPWSGTASWNPARHGVWTTLADLRASEGGGRAVDGEDDIKRAYCARFYCEAGAAFRPWSRH